MENYEINESHDGIVIRRLSDGAFIPVDEENRDYQQFLKDTKNA